MPGHIGPCMARLYGRQVTSDVQLLIIQVQKLRMIYFLNVNTNGFKLILIISSPSFTCLSVLEREGKKWSQTTGINYMQPAAFPISSAAHIEKS